MASLYLYPDRLEIELSTAERGFSFRRDNIVISRESIRNATITDDPWIWLRGIRKPGIHVPRVLAVGRWTSSTGSDFVLIKAKRQAVVLELDAAEFTRVIVSTSHADQLVAALRLDADVPDGFAPKRRAGER